MLAEQPGVRVCLSYRKKLISRPRQLNQEKLAAMVEAGKIDLRLESVVHEIGGDRITLQCDGEHCVLPNDQVFVFAGGVLPTKLLFGAGIQMERHFGARVEQLGVDGRPV